MSEYSRMSFQELMDIPYSFYLLLNRESWIASWQRSEKGIEFLKTLWRLEQTGADLESVREFERRE